MTLKKLYSKKARLSIAIHQAQKDVDRAILKRETLESYIYKCDSDITKKQSEMNNE